MSGRDSIGPPLTIPESSGHPRATIRIIMFFSPPPPPFFFEKLGNGFGSGKKNGEATLVPFCMRHGRDLHACMYPRAEL